MIVRTSILSLFFLGPTLALAAEPMSAEQTVISGPTMGTTYHVKLVDASPSDAAALRTEIAASLADIDCQLSTYRADSEISRFNRAKQGEWFPVSPATARIIIAAKQLNRQTNGALDITVGPLVRLWHFGPDALSNIQSPADIKPPTNDALAAARQRVGDQQLAVRTSPPALRKQIDGLEIDLSAIGEGYAIDRLAALINQRGIKNFLIELGGEVRAGGNSPSAQPWRVAIARPTDNAKIELAIPLVTTSQTDAALSTSGDYHRYFEHDGRRYSHIIDPTTARPITHNLASVTVAADEALTTDAWDTALMVLGPERGYDCAVAHHIAALFIVRSEGEFLVRVTPEWQARFATAASSSPAGPRTRSP